VCANRVSSFSPLVCWYRFFPPASANEGEHVHVESGAGGGGANCWTV
jgi:hypothetical protein